jgi:hypothetical protein
MLNNPRVTVNLADGSVHLFRFIHLPTLNLRKSKAAAAALLIKSHAHAGKILVFVDYIRNLEHALDATLLTCSWNFQHALGATLLINVLSELHFGVNQGLKEIHSQTDRGQRCVKHIF